MIRITFLSCTALALFSFILPAGVLAETDQDKHLDLDKFFLSIKNKLDNNVYGIPVYIQSNSTKKVQRGDVYGIIHHPFKQLKHSLQKPANWCDIVTLHLNIKACTVQHYDNWCRLTFYSGRKFYEKPQDTYQLNYRFSTNGNSAGYYHSMLSAARGPLGTSDYTIEVEAIPLNDNSSFLHFSYSYQQNFWTQFAMGAYLSTLGRKKIGFSVVGTDDNGKPVYIDGVRGVIERNAVRYYFTIQSYLDTLNSPPADHFLLSARHWYQLTEKYPEQLHELDEKEYLAYKKQERQDQIELQKQVSLANACPPDPAASGELF